MRNVSKKEPDLSDIMADLLSLTNGDIDAVDNAMEKALEETKGKTIDISRVKELLKEAA